MTSLNNNSTPSKIGVDVDVVLMYKGKGNVCVQNTLETSGPPLTLETHFSFDSVNSFSEDPSSIGMSDLESTPTNKSSTEITRNPIEEAPQQKSSVEITRNSPVNEIRYISKQRLEELEFIEKNMNDILRCAVDDYKYTEELKTIKKKTTNFIKKR